jgi:hypothetical protein
MSQAESLRREPVQELATVAGPWRDSEMEGDWKEYSFRGCEFGVEVGKVNEHVLERMPLTRLGIRIRGLEISTTFTSHMMELMGMHYTASESGHE